jgi:hypothetical protein
MNEPENLPGPANPDPAWEKQLTYIFPPTEFDMPEPPPLPPDSQEEK